MDQPDLGLVNQLASCISLIIYKIRFCMSAVLSSFKKIDDGKEFVKEVISVFNSR